MARMALRKWQLAGFGILTAGLMSASLFAAPAARPSSAAPRTAARKADAKIHFVEDDYVGALAAARKANRPLFVDAWAPWCHTCLSLRSYVFPDPALATLADRFVWLAIDTEKDSNAAFVKAYPIDTWPTLLIIDPKTETVRSTWRGALKVDELKAWLAEATGDQSTAWARDRRAETRLIELRRRKDTPACVAEAISSLRWLSPGTSRLNVGIEGLTCAQRLPTTAPKRAEDLAALSSAIEAMVTDPKFALLADDRSNGYATLVEAAEGSNDAARVAALAKRWNSFLEGAAAAATDPAGRAVFDAHRVLAALALKQPAIAIPALQASARDFPKDYNPPARLARLYLSAGRVPEARAEIDRALGLVYGPRRKRLEELRLEIATAEKAGKPASAM